MPIAHIGHKGTASSKSQDRKLVGLEYNFWNLEGIKYLL
jgi:hypothetical protein